VAQLAGHSKPFARASLLLIGLTWSLPFLQSRHGYPLTSFYSEWLAFGLGLAAVLLLFARESWREAELPVVALAPPALATLLGLQAALGLMPYPEQAVTASWYLLWSSLLILLARVLVRELGLAAVATTLAWFLLAGGILSALAGYAQHAHVTFGFDFLVTRKAAARVYGNIGQPNQFAAYLTMALCSAAYLYGCGRMRIWSAVACAAWLLPALALSGSRSPWLFLALVSVLIWFLLRARHEEEVREELRRVLAYTLGLLPGFILAGLVVSQWSGSASPAIAAATNAGTSTQRLFEVAAGLAPRIELSREAWQLFLSAPVLGVGWGQFAWHHFLHIAGEGVTTAPGVYNHAHNIVLHLLAETGTAGGVLAIGPIALWVADLRRVRLDLEWWWILALLMVLATHSMVEYPLWYSYFLGIAAVLLGVGAQRNFSLSLPGFARFTVTVLMLAGWFNLISIMQDYRSFEKLVFVPGSREAMKVDERTFAGAIARIHREPVLTPYVELAMAYGFTMDEQNLNDKLIFADRALRFAPVSYVAYHSALLLAVAGDGKAARNRFQQAARVYPQDLPEIRAELSKLAARRPDVFAPLLDLADAGPRESRQ